MINKVILIGNLGKDPEIRATQDGSKIANLSIATSEQWKDKQTGEKKEKTEWHNVTIFKEHIVNLIESHAKKGRKVMIEGSIHTRKYPGKDGVDKYFTEIVVSTAKHTFTFLDYSKLKSDKDLDKTALDYAFESKGNF